MWIFIIMATLRSRLGRAYVTGTRPPSKLSWQIKDPDPGVSDPGLTC